MYFDLKRPCGNCPFRRSEARVNLHPERVEDILDGVINQGQTFACHKTTVDTDDDDRAVTKDSRHCAGALILAEKQGVAGQMVRIAMRLGIYDPAVLDRAAFGDVFDSPAEMLRVHRRADRRNREPVSFNSPEPQP